MELTQSCSVQPWSPPSFQHRCCCQYGSVCNAVGVYGWEAETDPPRQTELRKDPLLQMLRPWYVFVLNMGQRVRLADRWG